MAFFDNIHFPFFTMQELNLDWILKELKCIAGFMPQDGNPGDVLTRKTSGASWEPPEAVNININSLPEDTEIGDNDQLVFYDISASANRKIKPPNMLDSMMSNATPLMDGTGSAGTSKKPARYDHKHPTDTSRQAALTGVQMNAVNSGAPANSFDAQGVLKSAHGGSPADAFDAQGVLKPEHGGNVRSAWGNLQSLTFPFSCTADGIVTIDCNPQDSSQPMLVYIKDSESHYVCTAQAVSGARSAMSFPVKGGLTYSLTYSSNLGNISMRYYALQ